MKLPSVAAVAKALKGYKPRRGEYPDVDPECADVIDVRLQVYENGQWVIHTGDSCYDQGHRGY